MEWVNPEELRYILALQRIPRIGDVRAKKLLAATGGSAFAVFRENKYHLAKIEGIGTQILKELRNPEYLKAADKELRFMETNHIRYALYTDSHYPELLRHCVDAPLVLFYRGHIRFSAKRFISIVGTRRITNYGKKVLYALFEELAVLKPTVVSGFAYGVDIFAHKLAIEHGLQTIACLAHGLNQYYPKSHARYASQMEENGGFITDFWSSSGPDREHFLKRNRIIAGISEATVVIESAEKGGSLVTASMANGYHREVFAIPGRIDDTYSVGCNNLIKRQQAHILSSAADLVYHLNWDIEISREPEETNTAPAIGHLNTEEQHIYGYLQRNGRTVLDLIARHCKLPVHKVTAVLLGLELKGAIRPLPGRHYEIS